MSRPPDYGLDEGNFELQTITIFVDETFTWNLTWQIWIVSAGFAREYFGTILEDRSSGICVEDLGLH